MKPVAKIHDELPVLEAEISFINAASMALSILSEGDFEVFATAKAWEGLGYWTADIERRLREMNDKSLPA